MVEKSTNNKPVLLGLPTETKILENFGILAIRHGQLDSMLKMLLKDLANISVEETLYANRYTNSSELRKRIQKIAKQRLGEGTPLLKLQALLGRADKLTDTRNEFIHSTWGHELDGEPVVRDSNHNWQPAPNAETLNKLNQDIFNLINDIRAARFGGFLEESLTKD
jgi:hypothetical protein